MNKEIDAESTPAHRGYRTLALVTFALIVTLYVAARYWRLTASCLWFDEIFTVHAARHTWTEIFYFVAADIIHPPLFYALLKVWIAIGGESVRWLRLLPAVISIVAIVPFTLLSRELKLKSSEIGLSLFLLAVNGYLIKYAQEVRMYSLLFCLSLFSVWLFFRLFNRDKSDRRTLVLLCLINLLLVYSHYAGWLVVALEAFSLLVWQRRKLPGFLITAGLLVLAYVPWIYELLKGARAGGQGLAQNIGWVSRPGISELLQYLVLLNRPFLFVQSSAQAGYNFVIATIAIVVFVVPIVILVVKSSRRPEYEPRNTILALGVFAFAPVVLAFLLSWVSPYSLWGTRHLIIAAGPFAILTALALLRLRPDWIKITAFSIAGVWILLSATVFLFSRPANFIWCSWEPLANQMSAVESGSNEPVTVYAYEDLVAYHLWFALRDQSDSKFKIGVVKNAPGMTEDPAYFLPRAFTDISSGQHLHAGDKTWVAFRANQWDETRPPLNLLRNEGLGVGQVLTFKAQGQQAFLVQLKRIQK